MARYYIDCEFDGHNGPLISFAIVGEGNDSLHIEVMDAPPPNDPWVAENVLPILCSHNSTTAIGVPLLEVGDALRRFIGSEPATIIADSPVDIGRFCQAISTGEDGGWQSLGCPRVTFEVHNVDCWPCDIPGAVQHNAWWDAMALRQKLQGVLP